MSVTSKHVTKNPRNENPRSLRQSSRLDHRTLGRPNLPRETVRKYVRWPQTRIPPDPCQFSAGVEGGRFLTRLRQEGPSSSHFTGENNQSGSCVCPRELLISSLFSLAGLTQRSAVKWTATQAEARGGWEVKPKTPMKQQTEEGRSILDRRDVGNDEKAMDWFCCCALHPRGRPRVGAWKSTCQIIQQKCKPRPSGRKGAGHRGCPRCERRRWGASVGPSPNNLANSTRKQVERTTWRFGAQGHPERAPGWPDPINAGRSNLKKLVEASAEQQNSRSILGGRL